VREGGAACMQLLTVELEQKNLEQETLKQKCSVGSGFLEVLFLILIKICTSTRKRS
jgi:hypothetical protein